MATPEGKVKDALKKGFNKMLVYGMTEAVAKIKAGETVNGYYFMAASNGRGEAGVADFVACIMGQYMEIEVKSDTGKLSGIQELHRDVVEAAFGDYHVVKGLDEAEQFISYMGVIVVKLKGAIMQAHEMRDAIEMKTKSDLPAEAIN